MFPGSTRGIQKSDPTLAEVLQSQGYVTAQFGKNHLGDRNEYPGHKCPEYLEKLGPLGVLHTWATDKDDATEDPKFGRVGRQKIENTGALTRKRMETFDAEVLDHALTWLDKHGKATRPLEKAQDLMERANRAGN